MRWSRLQYESHLSSGVDFGASDLAGQQEPGLIRYVRTTDITTQRSLTVEGVYATREQVPHSAVATEGDLLLTRSGSVGTTYLHSGKPVAVAGYLVRARLAPVHDPRFFAHWAQSRHFFDAVQTGAARSTIDNFSASKYGALTVPVPPLEVQRRIADFLDTETTLIDTLLATNHHASELARERRLAALHDVVKDAGGELAAVWQVTGGVTSGPRDWGDHVDVEGDRPFIRITNIPRDELRIDREQLLYVTPPSSDGQLNRVRLQADDVVVSITADIGSVAVVDQDLAGAAFNQHVARIRPTKGLDPTWLALALRTVGRPQFDGLTAGGTKQGLSLPDVRSVRVPVPSLVEQKRAVSQADGVFSSTKGILHALKAQSSLLAERRQALITAAVTGELDV